MSEHRRFWQEVPRERVLGVCTLLGIPSTYEGFEQAILANGATYARVYAVPGRPNMLEVEWEIPGDRAAEWYAALGARLRALGEGTPS